jgi:hypothetical protein
MAADDGKAERKAALKAARAKVANQKAALAAQNVRAAFLLKFYGNPKDFASFVETGDANALPPQLRGLWHKERR